MYHLKRLHIRKHKESAGGIESAGNNDAETVVVVTIAGIIPVPVRGTEVIAVIVPRAAAQDTIAH